MTLEQGPVSKSVQTQGQARTGAIGWQHEVMLSNAPEGTAMCTGASIGRVRWREGMKLCDGPWQESAGMNRHRDEIQAQYAWARDGGKDGSFSRYFLAEVGMQRHRLRTLAWLGGDDC